MSLHDQIKRQMDELDEMHGAPNGTVAIGTHIEAVRAAVYLLATELDAVKSEMRRHWPVPPGPN